MKYTFTFVLIAMCFATFSFGHITYHGCDYPEVTLQPEGTTDSNGTIRNRFSDGTFDIKWNSSSARWEIKEIFFWDLYYNTYPSAPNPPSLSTGSWIGLGCGQIPIATLSGDVQSTETLPIKLTSFIGEQKNASTVL